MIKLQRTGFYKLIETRHHHKILYLDDVPYAWIETATAGEILVATRTAHKTDCVLSVGDFRMYTVDDEPALTDQTHLELQTGPESWQGYLLLTGLPGARKKRARIIPTHEIITGAMADQGV